MPVHSSHLSDAVALCTCTCNDLHLKGVTLGSYTPDHVLERLLFIQPKGACEVRHLQQQAICRVGKDNGGQAALLSLAVGQAKIRTHPWVKQYAGQEVGSTADEFPPEAPAKDPTPSHIPRACDHIATMCLLDSACGGNP